MDNQTLQSTLTTLETKLNNAISNLKAIKRDPQAAQTNEYKARKAIKELDSAMDDVRRIKRDL